MPYADKEKILQYSRDYHKKLMEKPGEREKERTNAS